MKPISTPQSTKSATTKAIENNPCNMCRTLGFPTCKGHGASGGGGAGGGGGGGSSSESKSDAAYSSNGPSQKSPVLSGTIQAFDDAKSMFMESLLTNNSTQAYEAGLLFIKSDPLYGNLTFSMKPGLSKSEIKLIEDFFKEVKKEFESFKEQLAEKNVSVTNFNISISDDKLSIHIPNPKYYHLFIKHLENKNLLPIPNPEQEKKKEITNEVSNQSKAKKPSPFDDVLKGPKPKGWKKREE